MDKQISNKWNEAESRLTLEFECEDFIACVDFVNKISKLAEELDHHPDLHITSYKKLKIEIYTHSENKLTQKDYELARAIDELLGF